MIQVCASLRGANYMFFTDHQQMYSLSPHNILRTLLILNQLIHIHNYLTVFPEPVCAQAIRSRLANTMGNECFWTGVGFS